MSDTTKVNVVQINTKESIDNLTALKKQIKSLKSELLGLEEGTEDYNKKIKELGDAQFQLKDINEKAARNMTDTGEKLANVSKLAGGATSAMAGFTGILQLMGAENENTKKLTQNIISLMAVAQSFSAIEDSIDVFKNLKNAVSGTTKAMSGLKKAMITSGIGALIAGLGIATHALSKMNEEIKESNERFKEFAEIASNDISKFEMLRISYNNLGNDMKAKEAFIKENQSQFKSLGLSILGTTDAEKAFSENTDAVINALIARAKAQYIASQLAETLKEQAIQELEKDNLEKQKAEEDEAKKELNLFQTFWNTIATTGKEILGKNTSQKIDKANGQIEETKSKVNELKEELKKATKSANDLTSALNLGNSTTTKPKEELPNIDLQKLPGLDVEQEDAAQREIEAIRVKNEAKLQAEMEYEEMLSELREEETKKEEERQQHLQDSAVDTLMISLTSASDILNTLANNQDVTTKKGFERNKKLQKANATINFLQGLISAAATTAGYGLPFGPIAFAALAASLGTTYGVNMAKINSTTFDNNSNATSSVPSSSAIDTLSTNVTNVRNTPTDGDIAELGAKQPAQKVYVLASDIDHALKGRQTAVRNSSF